MELHAYTELHDWSVGTGDVVVVVAVDAVAAVTIAAVAAVTAVTVAAVAAVTVAVAGHIAAAGHIVKESSCILQGESSTGTVILREEGTKGTRKTRCCLA